MPKPASPRIDSVALSNEMAEIQERIQQMRLSREKQEIRKRNRGYREPLSAKGEKKKEARKQKNRKVIARKFFGFPLKGRKIRVSTMSELKLPHFSLGQGANGDVRGVYIASKNLLSVAVKVFLSAYEDTSSKREAEVLAKLSHPNIIKLIGIVLDNCSRHADNKKRRCLGIIMERMDGDLTRAIYNMTNKLSLSRKYLWILQVAMGLQYLHKHGLTHRDIKPQNILCKWPNIIKLADLGLVKNVSVEGSGCSGPVGTDGYTAPEAQMGDYSFAADVYSLGVVIWEFMHQKKPQDSATYHTHPDGTISPMQLPIDPEKMDDVMANLVKKCLSTSVEDRPSLKEIIDYFCERYKQERIDSPDETNTETSPVFFTWFAAVLLNLSIIPVKYVKRPPLIARPVQKPKRTKLQTPSRAQRNFQLVNIKKA